MITHTHARRIKQLSGQVLALLSEAAPRPLTFHAVKRALDCHKEPLRSALARLTEIEAIHVNPESRLITLLDAEVSLPDVPEAPPPPPVTLPASFDERLVHAAIRRRAEACVNAGDVAGAVSLLDKAAHRSRPEVATTFLVLGDLYLAGHRRYPEITPAEAERLRKRSGYLTGADIDDALASER